MFWLWTAGIIALTLAGLAAAALGVLYVSLRHRYLDYIVRIFQEKPLFIVPRGYPVDSAEDVYFRTSDGLALHGCYLATRAPQRRGVILFGLEFGSNCWACLPYCQGLIDAGFDVFTFESRSCGDSEHHAGYEPLQWVTDFEVRDAQAALAYLRSRADVDSGGIGFFGISKGAAAGLLAAARDASVRCCATDGVFATYTTMVPYMRKWIAIYSDRKWLQQLLPTWFYGLIGRAALRRIGRERGCRFPHLERAIGRLSPRPLLMIHGEGDTYIKPEMARALFDRAGPPKELWLVPGAKHNQAIQVADEEYHRRVLEFFMTHLAEPKRAAHAVAEAYRP